ncbi:YtxH domain-containing protein [Waterburya agarophytonicola K14]|uniref:YtxH domain-containing protein n=1 Tax=Waterburya agarophytonicola KI4 TaxID=2874699 RepID=A0A964BUW9_9CYAN|nr:YtxH domain-containing protein [Waterburya agarophytonicola]MCC0179604.1 YtxH domain-containing protein [Waterburya agarophytonicola KI4]
MSKENQTVIFIGGMIIGSAVGTIVGLLAAPRTGKETRKVIKKSADALPELAEDLSTSIQFQANRLSETTLENWEGTLNRLSQAIAAGIEASQATAQTSKSNPQDRDRNSSIADRL